MPSVYYSMKDKNILTDNNDDVRYYPQALIEQCGYRPLSNNRLIHRYFLFLQF